MALSAGRAAVEAATRARDWPGMLAGSVQVIAALQANSSLPTVTAVCIPGVTDVAVAELHAAIAALPPDPVLSVELEVAAWRSWQFRSHPLAVGPVELPAERVLSERLQAWRMERRRIVETVPAVGRGLCRRYPRPARALLVAAADCAPGGRRRCRRRRHGGDCER
jgi:hypothetical protein